MLRIPPILPPDQSEIMALDATTVPMAEDGVSSLTFGVAELSLNEEERHQRGVIVSSLNKSKTVIGEHQREFYQGAIQESIAAAEIEADIAENPFKEPPRKFKCQNCEKEALIQQRCVRCKKVTYCNRECQTAHWAVHKTSCTRVELIGQTAEQQATSGADVPESRRPKNVDFNPVKKSESKEDELTRGDTGDYHMSLVISLVQKKKFLVDNVKEKNPVLIFVHKNASFFGSMKRIPNFVGALGFDILEVNKKESPERQKINSSTMAFVVELKQLKRHFPHLPMVQDFINTTSNIPGCWFFIDFGEDPKKTTFEAGAMERIVFEKRMTSAPTQEAK
jgi:hypothetical protein